MEGGRANRGRSRDTCRPWRLFPLERRARAHRASGAPAGSTSVGVRAAGSDAEAGVPAGGRGRAISLGPEAAVPAEGVRSVGGTIADCRGASE